MAEHQETPTFPIPTGFSVQQPLRGYHIDLETLRRLYRNLSEIVGQLGDAVVASLVKREGQPDEEFEEERRNIRSIAFRVTVTIESSDGTRTVGDNVSIFDGDKIPEVTRSVYFTNGISFSKVAGSNPNDMFEIFLDFSKPPLLDWSSVLSAPTANNSHVAIKSYNILFKDSVLRTVQETLKSKRKKTSVFHQAFIYDFGLLFFAMPYAFYLTSKLSRQEIVSSQPIEWRIPLFVYAFFILIMIYRLIFSYFKWAFPVTTFSNNSDSSSKHRTLFGLLAFGAVGSAFYDLLKWVFLS